MSDSSPAQQLRSFLAKFEPRVAASARAAIARLRKKLPGAMEIVYDNYNALAIGFGPSDKASEAIFSIAVFPRWVSLFFLQSGAKLPDPDKVLKGSGTRVRHIVLTDPKILEQPAVKKLMALALKSAKKPLDPRQRRQLIIKSISAKQRPRRS
ncbi:MAG TPA: hypothetical protein VK743_23075 [Steroidobacteraceae bacterium]|jgi:hypothetical protein|nr:hypothetical protein [Steroidobacteraceae bacterium]